MQIVQGFFGRNEDGGLVFFYFSEELICCLESLYIPIQQMLKERKNNS